MSAADTVAVIALVKSASTALTNAVWETKVPDGTTATYPYVIVHPHAGIDTQTRQSSGNATENPEHTLHIVSGSGTSVQVTLELIKAKFVTAGIFQCPTISGRRNSLGYWRSPLPIQTENDVTPSLLFAVIELGWVSDPA